MKLFARVSIAVILGVSASCSSTQPPEHQARTGRSGVDLPGKVSLLRRIYPLNGAPPKTSSGKLRCRPRAFFAIVWGNKIFLTTAIEGPLVPGATAVKHIDEGKEYLHPDSVGADHKHTFKVICLNRDTGKILWEQTAFEGTPYDNRHRKSSFASSTATTDGKYVYAFFGTEGLFAYDLNGKLAWKERGRQARYFRHGRRHLADSL